MGIEQGQYTLWGVDGIPRGREWRVNGLFELAGSVVMVFTGTRYGLLRLTIETCSQAPPLDVEGWDDVVEVSQRSDASEVEVFSLSEDYRGNLPALRVAPGSPVRIRLHARGRDEAAKEYERLEEALEEHLLQMWPAPEADDVWHRLTDELGASIRAESSDESARIRLASGFARVEARKGSYWLAGIEVGRRGIRSAGSGLFVADSDGARVLTGTAEGPVWLTLEEYAGSPPLRPEGWDEVVEVSQRSDTGEVKVDLRLLAEPVALPKVRVPAGSSIRVRVHVRGRDEAAEHERIDEAIEEHLLQLWPAPEAEEVWHRLTDKFGETMRSQRGAR